MEKFKDNFSDRIENNEESLRELFSDYNPDLTEDTTFMLHLEHNLRSLEIVKSQEQELRRRSRIAISVALLTGFIFGCLFSLLIPFIEEGIRNISISWPLLNDYLIVEEFNLPFALTLIGATTAFISLNIFEFTSCLLQKKSVLIKRP